MKIEVRIVELMMYTYISNYWYVVDAFDVSIISLKYQADKTLG